MTHFGILCPADTGHLNPMTTLGCELLRRGHRVTVFGFLDAQATTLASGLEFQPLGEDEFPAGSIADNHAQRGKLSGVAAFRHTIKLVTQVSDLFLSQAPAIIKKAGVEALLVDQVSLEGGTIADFLNIPYITICNALMLNQEPNIPPIGMLWQYNPNLATRLRNQVSYKFFRLLAKSIREVISDYRRQWKLPM